MNFNRERKRTFTKNDETKETDKAENHSRSDDLFSKKWEAFVVKKDNVTREFVGKLAGCAQTPV